MPEVVHFQLQKASSSERIKESSINTQFWAIQTYFFSSCFPGFWYSWPALMFLIFLSLPSKRCSRAKEIRYNIKIIQTSFRLFWPFDCLKTLFDLSSICSTANTCENSYFDTQITAKDHRLMFSFYFYYSFNHGFLVSKETVVLRLWESEKKVWFYQTSW